MRPIANEQVSACALRNLARNLCKIIKTKARLSRQSGKRHLPLFGNSLKVQAQLLVGLPQLVAVVIDLLHYRLKFRHSRDVQFQFVS